MKLFLSKPLLTVVCIFLLPCFAFCGNKPKKEIYQLTIYQYTNAVQETVLNNYLKNALLPALHKKGYKNIGVFAALANDTAAMKYLYVYLPLKNIADQLYITQKLNKDTAYQIAGAEYLNAVYTNAPYKRMEVILLIAFPLAPQMELPKLTAAKKNRIYELRSYESATEKIFANKVQMFNEGGEITLFKRLNFNAVFYAEVIAGSHMPNLMYMTTFENKADRDAHWKNFVDSPEWKKLSALPEYQNNISHIDIIFLQPVEYSDF
jgi:NIPSNAP